jgi:hypothetical protein
MRTPHSVYSVRKWPVVTMLSLSVLLSACGPEPQATEVRTTAGAPNTPAVAASPSPTAPDPSAGLAGLLSAMKARGLAAGAKEITGFGWSFKGDWASISWVTKRIDAGTAKANGLRLFSDGRTELEKYDKLAVSSTFSLANLDTDELVAASAAIEKARGREWRANDYWYSPNGSSASTKGPYIALRTWDSTTSEPTADSGLCTFIQKYLFYSLRTHQITAEEYKNRVVSDPCDQ